MPESVCPACKRPIDPARAPIARVRGAKVVTFCSEECARAPEARLPADADAEAGDAADARDARPELADAPERAPRMSTKRRVGLLSAAVLTGGMVITIIGAVSPSTPSDVSAAAHRGAGRGAVPLVRDTDVRDPDGPAADTPDGPDGPDGTAARAGAQAAPAREIDADPARLLARATALLRDTARSPSPRLAQLAAMALARTGDPGAVAALIELREREASDLGQIAIDYALGRAGDAPALERLRVALADKRRDIRLDAARALVQLGDRAGVKLLRRTLRLPTHRLGVAGLLARLGDAEGLSALRKALSDGRASVEDKMRAAVALGRAGDESVRVRLVGILKDGRYHVGAAEALAVLGDPVAVPALVAQLDLPSMRVRAALGLRRLRAEVDLAPLAGALEEGGRGGVTAAEAILILAGPERLAERD